MFLKIKNGIAIAMLKYNPLISFDCDKVEEIDDKLAYNINLPCKKVNGEWIHTEEYPVIEYPVSEQVEQEPTIEEQITNIQELVVQQQYELELLKLGIEV